MSKPLELKLRAGAQTLGLALSDSQVAQLLAYQDLIEIRKAIDAALPAEPAVSSALRLGGVVAVANDYDVYPIHQISEILYSGRFATADVDLARRFMRASSSA